MDIQSRRDGGCWPSYRHIFKNANECSHRAAFAAAVGPVAAVIIEMPINGHSPLPWRRLRCEGDGLDEESLSRLEGKLCEAVESSLGGPMDDDSWVQTNSGVGADGLGDRLRCNFFLRA